MNSVLWAFAFVVLAFVPATLTQASTRPAVAVFDFEFIDTSLEGAVNGSPRADEKIRLMEISKRLRQWFAGSNKARIVDSGPVAARSHEAHLRECGGCDADFARQVGAQLSITGTVQKVSNLILNMNIYVRDVKSGRMLSVMSADMRGNTEESWMRALDWLIRNRLSPALDGVQQ
ncbi:MAG TPA: DUF3280 domain-containing protein [Pseudolabrys sp.]|jgi:hypothetical protein|nr:DUF3280 domain-containing protein [Pseudolabrys sp.]